MLVHAVETGELVEMIIQILSPVRRLFAFQQRQERHALHLLRDINAAHLQESRSEVDILRQLRDMRSCLDFRGETHHHRHFHGLFIHETLVEPSVLAYIESLVAAIYDDGVVEQPFLFQVIQHFAYAFVKGSNRCHVLTCVALVFPDGEVFPLRVLFPERVVFRTVVVVEPFPLFGCHSPVQVLPRVEPQGVAAFGYVHLQVVPFVHVAIDVHLLFLGGFTSFIVVEIVFGDGEVYLVI